MRFKADWSINCPEYLSYTPLLLQILYSEYSIYIKEINCWKTKVTATSLQEALQKVDRLRQSGLRLRRRRKGLGQGGRLFKGGLPLPRVGSIVTRPGHGLCDLPEYAAR